jgi:alkylation response protein AidB-like acyl-CoA dehydrogenase
MDVDVEGGPFAVPEHERVWIERARELAASFAAQADALDASGELPVAQLTALQSAGLDGALLPREHGGEGLSYRAYTRIVRLLAAAEPSTATIWTMHTGAALALVQLCAPDVAAFYAAELRAGRRFANALSEPTSGNLFLVPLQPADPVPGGWSLTGAKRFISGAEGADHYLVNAVVDGVPGFFGVRRDETVSFTPIWDTLGLRATRSQLVTFDRTLLPESTRARPPDLTDANLISAGLPFLSLGIADAALAALVAHARGRVLPTTGEPLAAMQWVEFEVAEAAVRLRAASLLADETAWLADHGSPRFLPCALEAKLLANQVAVDVAQLGVRIGGASGYLRTSPIQRHFRDAQAGQLMAYSTEVARGFIGKQLLAPPPGAPGSA